MAVNKRDKRSRARGSWTHGWGEKKKHRGGGSRGGRGMAGSGKRGDSKKPSLWADRLYLSKQGFISRSRTIPSTIMNVMDLDAKIDKLVEQKKAENKNGSYTIDAEKAGFNKLLGKGKTSKKITITVEKASPQAIEKIEAAGGKVIMPQTEPAKK
jgi:large subunit ribosomal protein L15